MSEDPENDSKESSASSVDTGSSTDSIGLIFTPAERVNFIEQAIKDHQSPLIGYATSILHDLDLARDVVQDTFIRLCEQEIGKISGNVKSWLFTVCRNRSLDVLRKEKRSQPLEDVRWQKVAGPGLQPDEKIQQDDRASQIFGYLDHLTDRQREVIILKFQQGLSYQEIHRITGLTTGNIGFIIHTALKRLREIIPDDLRS